MNTYRTTARIIGLLFLTGMVVYISGNVLVQSILTAPDHLSTIPAKSMLLAAGAMLMLMAAVFDAAHGIVILPVLKQHNERIAFSYLGYRIVDAVLIAVGIVFLLLQIPLGREYLQAGAAGAPYLQSFSNVAEQAHLYAYEIGMLFVGIAGLMLTYTFYKANLVPRLIAAWGLVGYSFLLVGSALQVVGFDLRLMHTIPGGLWELFIGVWLIVKGFKTSAFAEGVTETSRQAGPLVSIPATGRSSDDLVHETRSR